MNPCCLYLVSFPKLSPGLVTTFISYIPAPPRLLSEGNLYSYHMTNIAPSEASC